MWSTLLRGSLRLQCLRCAGVVSHLTTQEVSAALRPFYFIVHPDLFGQFPSERAVNEDSLKKLSEYVSSLQVSGKSRPTELVFFIRKETPLEGQMKRVSIQLSDSNLRVTILNILKCCGLPADYVNSIPVSTAEGSGKPFRPIDWHPSFYTATGKADPKRRSHKPAPQVTLRTWLQQNAHHSRQRMDAVFHSLEDVRHLCSVLKDSLRLSDIRWDSRWGLTHFRACLKSFSRLYAQHPEVMTSILTDRTLVFSNTTGVTRQGEIILSSEDVPTSWMRLLASVSAYDAVLDRLPIMEQKLSELLNGIQIVRHERPHSHVMAEDYELLLNKFLNSLRRCQDYVTASFGDTDLSQLHMVLDGENAPMTLASRGFFLIPASVPGTMAVDFIQQHKEEALGLLQDIDSCLQKEAHVVAECVSALELVELTKDETVTPQQMTRCCQRLRDQHWQLCLSLTQSRLHVSHYYSVMQDGQMCIPWDWQGDEDAYHL